MVTEAELYPNHKIKIKEKDAGVRGRAASSPNVKRMASIPEEPIEMLPRPRVEVEGQEIKIDNAPELEPDDDSPCIDSCELQMQEPSKHVLEYVDKIREAIMLQGIRVQREEEETLKEVVEGEVTNPDVHEENKIQETQKKKKKKKKRESVFWAVSVKTKDAFAGLKAKRKNIFDDVEVKSENASLKINYVGNKISRALSTRRAVEGGGIINIRDSTAKPKKEPETKKTRTDDSVVITTPPSSSQDLESEKDDDKTTTDHIEFKSESKSEIEVPSATDTGNDDDDGDEYAALLPRSAEMSSSVPADSTSRSKQTGRRYRSPTPYGNRTTSDARRRRHLPIPMRTSTTGVLRKGFGLARGVVDDVKMTAKDVLSVHRKIGGWSRL